MKRYLKTLIVCLFAGLSAGAQAQQGWDYNFGLHYKQDRMPEARSPKAQVQRKARVETPGALTPTGDNQYIISGGWNMIEAEKTISRPILEPSCDLSQWYNATVPGTVLTTLVEQGAYPDPYIGLNNMQIPDTLCRMDWWYRVRFDMPQDAPKSDCARLLFNGINYKAQVWLNGERLGNIFGAFRRGSFEVGRLLRDKDNVLAVHILPVNNPGIPHEQTVGEQGPNGGLLCLDGPTFIATEGWDWMPAMRDRSIGIWQDVRLCFSGEVTLEDPQIITDLPLPDTTRAEITVRTTLRNNSSQAREVTVYGSIGDIRFEKQLHLPARGGGGNSEVVFSPDEFPQLRLADPQLWWPNGYGPQPLYDLKLAVSDNGTPSDQKTIRFGIREMSYQMMVDAPEQPGMRISYSPTDITDKRPLFCYNHEKMRRTEVNPDVQIPLLREGVRLSEFEQAEKSDNPYLVIRVNGVPIFCKGGDWGMDDAMKRCSREQLEPYIKLHAREHFNMIRNWQGQSTGEDLYNLCDEYGLLVWNDFSISTGWYSLRPHDFELFLANAADVVKRYVNHPSIAMWCCGNETYAPEWLEERFQQLIAREDGTRHYHGNSRYINMTTSGPWRYIPDFTEYYRKLAFGFNTELGAPSVPTYETLCRFMPEEDMWPKGDVWSYHDALVSGWVGWNEYCADIDVLGAEPCADAREFCRRAQVVNYNQHRVMFEAWNDKMWESTTGVLYWMSHPAWYSVVQQTYSWDYKTFGTFFGCRKSCEPTHIQWNLNDHRVQVINASQTDHKGLRASFEVFSTDGRRLLTRSQGVSVAPNSKADLFTQQLPALDHKLALVRLRLTDASGRTLSVNDYWCNGQGYTNAPKGICDLTATTLRMRIVASDPEQGTCVAEVRNTGKCVAPFVEMNAERNSDGASILPAYLSDSYFNLLPGESRRITLELPTAAPAATIVARALNSDGACALR